MGGTKAGPRGTAMPSSGEPLKSMEKHGKPCLAPYVESFVAVVNNVQTEEVSVHHVQNY